MEFFMKLLTQPVWLALNLVLLGVKLPLLFIVAPIKFLKDKEFDFGEYFSFHDFGLKD